MKKTSKYKVIPFKSKPLKAKIKDYTAVRVLSRIGKIFRRKWVNLTGGIVGAFRADKQEQIGNEIEAITKNIEDNKKLLDQFYKASQKNTQEDHKAATAVKKHIEKLEKRLLKLSKDQPNNSASLDLNQVLRNNLEPKAQEYLSDEELSQVFGDAPVKPIETAAPEAKPEPVPEAKPEPVQKSVDEKEALPELTPENVAEQVKKASEDIKNIAIENAKLKPENARLQAENDKLQAENDKLQAEKARLQAENDELKKENKTLNENAKNQTTLEAKVGQYEAKIASLEREITEMEAELEKYRFSSKSYEKQLQLLSEDVQKAGQARDYYKNQLANLLTAMDFKDPLATPAQTTEDRQR